MAKSKYDTVIKPHFDEITELLRKGYTEKEIARNLGVSETTWYKYKAEKAEFSELLIKSRGEPVEILIGQTYKSALGFKTTIKRYTKIKNVSYNPETGKKLKEKEELVEYEEEIYIPPNFQAAKFLIMNWGRELGYCSEPAAQDLKEREFEHKKEMDEANMW